MPRIDEREEEKEKTHKSKLGFYGGERRERIINVEKFNGFWRHLFI